MITAALEGLDNMLGFKGLISQSVLVLAISTRAHAWQQTPSQSALGKGSATPAALIQQYCVSCHDDSARTANCLGRDARVVVAADGGMRRQRRLPISTSSRTT